MIKDIKHEAERMTTTFETMHKFLVVFEVAAGEVRHAHMAVQSGLPADTFAKGLREWADKIDAEYKKHNGG